MLKIRYQTSFKKDIKRIQKRGYDISLMKPVIDALAAQQELDEKYHDHPELLKSTARSPASRQRSGKKNAADGQPF